MRHSIDEVGEPTRGTQWREGRIGLKGLVVGKMTETQNSQLILTKQHKLAHLASSKRNVALKTLAHHIDLDWLREAYRRTRKTGAVGVDGVDATAYEEHLDDNLQSLLNRFKSGVYRAPAVRRVHIEKDGSKETRPIGIPTLEDKILQRAVLMVMEPVFEQDFLDCSYGFRPGRSAHGALEHLRDGLMNLGGGWIIDLDIRQFFDRVDRGHLSEMLDQRVVDGDIRRVIGKWMRAGVMEGQVLSYPEVGTPQGGVISPWISNVYLHGVLDTWFENQVKPRLRGRAFMVRFADDATLCFEYEEDARKVMAVLPKRFNRFGLELNEAKTKLVAFQRPRGANRANQAKPAQSTFDFLSFTHFWARSRKGYWVIKRKTAKQRFSRALKRMSEWCRQNRHRPIAEQHQQLNRKLLGHYAYFGITGNSRSIQRFAREVERIWRKWLGRRSGKAHKTWEWYLRLLKRYPLARPRVVHSVYHPPAKP